MFRRALLTITVALHGAAIVVPPIASAQGTPAPSPSAEEEPASEERGEAELDEVEVPSAPPASFSEEEQRALEGGRLQPIESPTDREVEEEPSIEELELALEPTPPAVPEWRIRAGGGVAIKTEGDVAVYGRITEEVEFQPTAFEFISFAIGSSQNIADLVLAQVYARLGGYATILDGGNARIIGALNVGIGAVVGAVNAFDFSADVDLRLLLAQVLEIHVRGGFFGGVDPAPTFASFSGGVGVAF